MPLSFPLALSAFYDLIQIGESEFYLSNPREVNRMAGGAQVSASLGDAIWRGRFALPRSNDRARSAQRDALVSVLDRAGASFLAYDRTKPYPAADPDGSLLGAAVPRIGGFDAPDARLLSLVDLPGEYQLSGGDLIGWQYGASPLRYALHRIVSDVQASEGGATGLFEVTPFIAPGAAVGTAVTLIRPVIKAVLEPEPSYGLHRSGGSEGAEISFVQTMR